MHWPQKAHTKPFNHQSETTRPGGIVAGGVVGSGAVVEGMVTPGVGPPPVFDGTVTTGGFTVLIGPVGVGSGGAVGDGPMVVGAGPVGVAAGGIAGDGGGSSQSPSLRTSGGTQGTVVVVVVVG